MFFDKGFNYSYKKCLLALMFFMISNTSFGIMKMVNYGMEKGLPCDEGGMFSTLFKNIDLQYESAEYDKLLGEVAKLMRVEITNTSAILAANLVGGLTGESGEAYAAYSDDSRYPKDLKQAKDIYKNKRNAVNPKFRPEVMRSLPTLAEGLYRCGITKALATSDDIKAAASYCNGFNSILALGLSCMPDFKRLDDFLNKNKLTILCTKWTDSGFKVVLDESFKSIFSILVYIYREGLENKKSLNGILTFVNDVTTAEIAEAAEAAETKNPPKENPMLDLSNSEVSIKIGKIKLELEDHLSRLGDLHDIPGFKLAKMDIEGKVQSCYYASVLHFGAIFHLFAKKDMSYRHKNEFRFACQVMMAQAFGNKLPSIDIDRPEILDKKYDARFSQEDLYINFNQSLSDMTVSASIELSLFNYEEEAEKKAIESGNSHSMAFYMADRALLNNPVENNKSYFFRRLEVNREQEKDEVSMEEVGGESAME